MESEATAADAAVRPEGAEPAHSSAPISEQHEIGKLAYSYWEARGFQGGSAEEDWLRAEAEFHQRREASTS